MQLNKLHFSVDLLFLSSPTGHKEEAGVFQYKHVLLSISFTPYPIPSNFQKKKLRKIKKCTKPPTIVKTYK